MSTAIIFYHFNMYYINIEQLFYNKRKWLYSSIFQINLKVNKSWERLNTQLSLYNM